MIAEIALDMFRANLSYPPNSFSSLFHSYGRECRPLHHLGSENRRLSMVTSKAA
jgi:hypothetical protein